jgi:hypothetical protein
MMTRRRDHKHNHQTGDNQHDGDQAGQGDAAPAGWELATDDPVLALKVAVEADEEDDDADSQEGGAEGFAQVAEAGGGMGIECCGSGVQELVEEGGGAVFARGGDGVGLLVQHGLDVGVDFWGEACAHQGAQGEGSGGLVSAVEGVGVVVLVSFSLLLLGFCKAGVQAEKLCDGDADAGECEGGAEPGEKGTFQGEVVSCD